MREQIAVLDGIQTSPVPGDGQNYTGGSDWFPGAPYRLQQEGLASFAAGSTIEAERVSPVPGDGQNYTGGSDWFPGAPYRLQQEGLAAAHAFPTSPVPGDGQNYTGGSDWFPGAPYRLQQEGLAALRRRGSALRGTEVGARYAVLYAQGLRMGLTREAARFRAQRIMGGW